MRTVVLKGDTLQMRSQQQNLSSSSQEETSRSLRSGRPRGRVTGVTQTRAKAQQAKIDQEAQQRLQHPAQEPSEQEQGSDSQEWQPRRRAKMTVERAIAAYLDDHIGGNHCEKILEWHRTALSLLQEYVHQERQILLMELIDAPDITAWFTYLRKTPGGRGKLRSERTVQTYARSARAFFHWLVRQG